ncbi:MAG: hypothetical protein ACOYJX_07540 [Acutalibacteraceae bacterium]|jgi:hypothetical protein
MTEEFDLPESEKEVAAEIDALVSDDFNSALSFCERMLEYYENSGNLSRSVSACFARCLCCFLLHKKNKSRLLIVIEENEKIRTAFFGRLNTPKYSLIFVLKRIFKGNNTVMIREVLELLADNPFRDDEAKDYSDRWSLKFVIEQALAAPEEYLNLSSENRQLIKSYLSAATSEN